MEETEILRIYVNIREVNELVSENATVRMLLFDGYCTGRFFNGKILNGGVDTQLIRGKEKAVLSARYMLQGRDGRNECCRLFIENNSVNTAVKDGKSGEGAEEGAVFTRPKIYTDSSALKWLEKEELLGRVGEEDGRLVIIIRKAD